MRETPEPDQLGVGDEFFQHGRSRKEIVDDFHTFLKQVYGNVVRGWRSALDKDGNGRISWVEFCTAAREMGFSGGQSWNPRDIRELWCVLDRDGSGFLTLDELDRQGYELLCHFKETIDMQFGGIEQGFRSMDPDENGQIHVREVYLTLRKFNRLQWTPATVQKLFNRLDLGNTGFLTLDNLAFLETMDVAAKQKTVFRDTVRVGV
mmetsp:Transcript_18421/g.44988  ORF Transcript_18421/g.44988 Transcript_18421/m.44988 type:complete len:206 (+) Transcript_18421:2-619(+)